MTSDFHENLYRVRYWSKINVYLILNCFEQIGHGNPLLPSEQICRSRTPILPTVALESKYPGQNFTHFLTLS